MTFVNKLEIFFQPSLNKTLNICKVKNKLKSTKKMILVHGDVKTVNMGDVKIDMNGWRM